MGYLIRQGDTMIKIRRENHELALAAIKGLSKGKYSWVHSAFRTASNLVEALDAWCWEADFNDEGDISHLIFFGDELGDDSELFEALAPYIEVGSYITFYGEDDSTWRYVFDGYHCRELRGVTTYI